MLMSGKILNLKNVGPAPRTVMVEKDLGGTVAVWIEGSTDRAFMRPSEAYRLAQVLLGQIGMDLPDVEGLV